MVAKVIGGHWGLVPKLGKLVIINEGRIKKFLNMVEQVTFNGDLAFESGKIFIM